MQCNAVQWCLPPCISQIALHCSIFLPDSARARVQTASTRLQRRWQSGSTQTRKRRGRALSVPLPVRIWPQPQVPWFGNPATNLNTICFGWDGGGGTSKTEPAIHPLKCCPNPLDQILLDFGTDLETYSQGSWAKLISDITASKFVCPIVWSFIVWWNQSNSSFSRQQLQVFGQSGANGQSATPLRPIARSSDSATAMLSRPMSVMATQFRWLHAQINHPAKMQPIQVTFGGIDF